MSSFISKTAILFAVCLLTTLPAYSQFDMRWDNGFKLTSEDKNFKLKFGGRIQWDVAWFHQSDSLTTQFGEITNGAEFRRVRFYNKGTFYKNVGYKLQLDFAGGKIVFKDVFVEFLNIPVIGSFRAGHFKEPLRLGSLMSSNNLVFMERANFDSFSEDRNSGALIKNSYNDDKFGWQLGAFRNSNAAGDNPASNDEINITGRVTTLIINNKEKRELLHLGLGGSFRNPKFNNYIVSARPPAHLAPKYLSTNIIEDVVSTNILNGEVAYLKGRFAAQGEYLYTIVDAVENYNFQAYYIQTSFVITGEQRPYKGSYDGFSKLTPYKNFGDGGGGAWEVGLRYSVMDLNDKDLDGGIMRSVTAGVNWYANQAVMVKLNYVYSFMSEAQQVNIIEMRFQAVF